MEHLASRWASPAAAGEDQDRQDARQACRPACGDGSLSQGRALAGRARALRGVGEALARASTRGGGCHVLLARVGSRLAALTRRRERAHKVERNIRNAGLGRARRARTRLAARPAARRHPRRSVSRQRVFPRRLVCGHRFLLRPHRLRRCHLPQRRASRPIIPTTSPKAARCSRATPRRGRFLRKNGRAARARGALVRFLLTLCSTGSTPGAMVPRNPARICEKTSLSSENQKPRDYGEPVEPRTPVPPHVVIHTDGACSGNPGPGGWGAILIERAQRRRSRHTTTAWSWWPLPRSKR